MKSETSDTPERRINQTDGVYVPYVEYRTSTNYYFLTQVCRHARRYCGSIDGNHFHILPVRADVT